MHLFGGAFSMHLTLPLIRIAESDKNGAAKAVPLIFYLSESKE
jgi:hypothetical protein